MLDRVEEAIRAFEALDRDPYAVDLTALSAYINALVRAGRMEAALRVLLRSDEAASQAGGCPTDGRAADIMSLLFQLDAGQASGMQRCRAWLSNIAASW